MRCVEMGGRGREEITVFYQETLMMFWEIKIFFILMPFLHDAAYIP